MRCPKHRRNASSADPKDICPRCTRSTNIVSTRRVPGLLTYYRNLCRSSKCLIHGKTHSTKMKKSGTYFRRTKKFESPQVSKKTQKADVLKIPWTVDEFEEEKNSLEDIDFNMFTKIDAAVEDLEKTAEINFEATAGNRFVKEIINSQSEEPFEVELAGEQLALTKTIIWPLKKPEIFKGLRTAPKGVLLFGPPGTGKTFLGKLIASETNSTFFNISPSILTSKWMGENEKLVRTMFLVAKARQPSIIFIDEIDSILSKRTPNENGSTRRMKNEFLFCMGDSSAVQEDRIMVIGATNRPHELDEGAMHRFFKRLYIPLPDSIDRKEILLKLLESECHSLDETDISDVVRKTNGYSVSDLKNLCQEAAMGPIKGLAGSAIIRLKADKIRPISMEDFLWALQLIKPTVSREQIKAYEEWDSMYGYGGESNTLPN